MQNKITEKQTNNENNLQKIMKTLGSYTPKQSVEQSLVSAKILRLLEKK